MVRTTATPMQRAAAVGGRQRGLLTLDGAEAAGLSDDQVEHAAAAGGWQRLARGLYAMTGSTPCWQRDAVAACLLGGTDALASHLTAAALWGWVAPPVLPHITVPLSQSARTPLAKVHRSAVPGVDRATRDGIRCTSASRTLVDCAGIVERPRFELLVDDALCSKVATARSIEAAAERAGRRGRRGMATLDAVLAVWCEDITPESPAEVRLLRCVAGLGIVGAVTQHEVFDEDGTFVARLDVALPDRLHGLEYDSDRWHNPRRFDREEARLERLAGLGWRIDPVCKLDLLPSSTRLAELFAA